MSSGDVLSRLTGLVAAAVRPRLAEWGREELADQLALERPATSGHGDLATNIAMVAAGSAGMPPREAAALLVEDIQGDRGLAGQCRSIEIAGPGFINFFLEDKAMSGAALEALAAGMDYGSSVVAEPQSILLEYVSANPTGPLHVGHARYAAFGDSLKRILRYAGHQVTTEFYINDHGTQMITFGRSLAARYAQLFGREVEFPADGYQGDYTVHIAELIRDEIGDSMVDDVDPEPSERAMEIFKDMGGRMVLDEMRRMLELFRVEFDVWFSESELFEKNLVDEAADDLTVSGDLEEREGARWLLTSRYGDDKDRVVIRSSGEPTYFASDIAYHRLKLSRGFDHLINIWGADHHGYVPRMKAAFEALSHDPGRLEIIIGQLVNVMQMGERKQMSKRAGTLVTLDELLDSIGVDAARFFLVDRSSDSTLDLDIEKARLKSEENPVYYVQYAHARICSILKRAKAEAVEGGRSSAYESVTEQERELILKIMEFPRLVLNAAGTRAPHRVTSFARELAATFHVFYHNCPVIKAEPDTAAFRLDLCLLTRNVIARCLDLVGVEAPESM